MKHKKSLLGLMLICYFLMILSSNSLASQTNPIGSSYSGNVILNYDTHTAIQGYAGEKIEWSFETSNSIGIKVELMDSDNYNNFLITAPYTSEILSSGSWDSDFGTEYIYDYKNYYVVFENKDSAMQSTTLTYSVDFDPTMFPDIPVYIIFPIISAVISIVIIMIAVAARRSRVSRPKTTYAPTYRTPPYRVQHPQSPQSPPAYAQGSISSQYQPRSTQPARPQPPVVNKDLPHKYCELCGEKIDADSKFCPNCGERFG